MAAVGAPCSLTLLKYLGNQPSADAWYSVREEPAIEVMMARTSAKIIIAISKLVMAGPAPMMLAIAAATPIPE